MYFINDLYFVFYNVKIALIEMEVGTSQKLTPQRQQKNRIPQAQFSNEFILFEFSLHPKIDSIGTIFNQHNWYSVNHTVECQMKFNFRMNSSEMTIGNNRKYVGDTVASAAEILTLGDYPKTKKNVTLLYRFTFSVTIFIKRFVGQHHKSKHL